jgi:hypothetical protein
VTYNGHWSLVHRLLAPPEFCAGRDAVYQNRTYRLFADGESRVKGVLGEFYWRVTRGEVARVSDYIAPPGVLSRETYPGLQEVTWSAGDYRTPAEIAAAFQLTVPLPPAHGRYLNEPNPHAAKWPRVRIPALLAVLAVIFLQLYFLANNSTRPLYASTYPAQLPAGTEEVSTAEFFVRGHTQPLRVRVNAPLNDNWLDVGLQLVETSTGETRAGNVSLSFYSGYDSDGAWSEGSRSGSADFPAIEPGRYLLRLSPETDARAPALPFSLQVEAGGLFWSNFIASLLLVAAYPAWLLLRRHSFEKSRWSESDYSPYGSSSSESDDD